MLDITKMWNKRPKHLSRAGRKLMMLRVVNAVKSQHKVERVK